MKLISLNVELGAGNVETIIDFIQKEDPDLICLQEVSNPLGEKVKEEYKFKENFDKALTGVYPYSFWGGLSQTFSETKEVIKEFGGLIEHGNYFLSKSPINYAESIFYFKNFSFVPSWYKKHNQTGRAFQRIELKINNKKLQVVNNHGIIRNERLGNEDTEKECSMILNSVKQSRIENTIIIGDFNLLPQSNSLTSLVEDFEEHVTSNNYSSTRPLPKQMIVDYCFTQNIAVKRFKVEKVNISDHFPLILEF